MDSEVFVIYNYKPLEGRDSVTLGPPSLWDIKSELPVGLAANEGHSRWWLGAAPKV